MAIIKNSEIGFVGSLSYSEAHSSSQNTENKGKIYFTTDENGSILVNGKIYGTTNSDFISAPSRGPLKDYIDGQIPTLEDLNGITPGDVDTKITTAIQKLDKSDTAVAGQYVSAVSETDGVITVSRTALPSKADTPVNKQYVSAVSQSNGAITVSRANLPTLGDLNGITPGEVDTKISTAIGKLDKSDAAVAGQYVSAVSETDGVITVSRASLPSKSDGPVTGQYVSAVSQSNGAITVSRAKLPSLSDLNGITPGDVDNKITTAIENLDKSDAAVTGKYVSAVSQSNGVITVTRADLPTNVESANKLNTDAGNDETPAYFSNGVPVQVKGISNALIHKSEGTSELSWGNETTLATIAGLNINATLPAKPTLSDLGGIKPADVDTKITTAIQKLDKADTAVNKQYVSAVSETDGIISVSRANLPTLGDLNGITPGEVDTKITTAIQKLDKADTAVNKQYVSAVSQSDGIITVSRANLPTLGDLNGITPADVDTKITTAIQKLDKSDTAVNNQYVSAVSETDGIITVSRASLPVIGVDTTNSTIDIYTYNNKFTTNTGTIGLSLVGSKVKLSVDGISDLVDKNYIDQKIADLVGAAPEALNTLEEVSEWIKNDETGTAQILSDISELEKSTSYLENLVGKVEDNHEADMNSVNNEIDALNTINNKLFECGETNNPVYISKILSNGVWYYQFNPIRELSSDILPPAKDDELGAIKTSYASTVVGDTQYCAVQLNTSYQAFVEVPWNQEAFEDSISDIADAIDSISNQLVWQ